MKSKTGVAFSSVVASLFLTGIKLVVGLLTGSIGILSEAAHSLLDLGAASLTYFAVKVGDKPPDKRHPYGHGKVESVSALIETGLLFLTSFWIIYEAVKRLLEARAEIEVAWYSFAVMFVSIIVDFSRSRALLKVAKETKSQALEADALHFSSDILSSAVVITGLALALLGINKADAIAALGVSIFVLHAGYSLGKRTLDVLMDAAPIGLLDQVTKISSSVDGVLGIKKTRVRNVGAVAFVDLCVLISRNVPIEGVSKIKNDIENQIRAAIHEADITIETEPISLSNETIIDQVRTAANKQNLSIHDISVYTEHEKKYINFDLEVSSNLDFKDAHHIATDFKKILESEFGEEVEVNIHIEPLYPDAVKSLPITEKESSQLEKEIVKMSKNIKTIKDAHNIEMRRIGRSDIFVSLHCTFPDDESLEDVHEATSVFENAIRMKYPQVKRVLVHAEPESEKNI